MFGQPSASSPAAARTKFGAAYQAQAQTAAPAQNSLNHFMTAMKGHNLNQPALPYTSAGRLNIIA